MNSSLLGRWPSRPGISLVELLVAIGIATVLMGLSFVAISAAREATRRTTCLNNARQLLLALHHYHQNYGALPPAVIWEPPGEPLGDGRLPIGLIDRVARGGQLKDDTIYGNWAIALLPYLDRNDLAETFDSTVPISHPRNSNVRTASLAVMTCPSDPYSQEGNPYARGLAADLANHLYARGNWAINVGPDADCVNGMPTEDDVTCINGFFATGRDLRIDNYQVWGSGVAGVNRSFRLADLSDGQSTTLVLDEIRAGIDELDPRGVWALGQIGASAVARHGRLSDAGGPNPTAPGSDEIIGCVALAQRHGIGWLTVQGMGCALTVPEREINAQAAAKSLHPGGVNVGFADGSARFIVNEINIDVWHALHTRNGGERIATSDY